MASEAELLEAKRQLDYRELPARSYISRNTGVRMPFDWTINFKTFLPLLVLRTFLTITSQRGS